MHPRFKDYLDQGYLEPARRADGSPFTHEGTAYYHATQAGANLSIKRFFALGDTVQRHSSLKLTDSVLETAHQTLIDLFNEGLRQLLRGDGSEPDTSAMIEGVTILKRLQARQRLGVDVEMIYELAAIWLMSEDEDPIEHDPAKNRQKIAAWSQNPQTLGFFLSTPLSHFSPWGGVFEAATQTASQQLNHWELLDLTRILLQQQPLGLTSATVATIESRRATLFGLDGLLGADSKNTTSLSTPTSA